MPTLSPSRLLRSWLVVVSVVKPSLSLFCRRRFLFCVRSADSRLSGLFWGGGKDGSESTVRYLSICALARVVVLFCPAVTGWSVMRAHVKKLNIILYQYMSTACTQACLAACRATT
jgi:hypothetical protein